MFNKNKGCSHKWEVKGPIVITQNGKDFARMSFYCPKCMMSIHKPIFTLVELKKLEGDDD